MDSFDWQGEAPPLPRTRNACFLPIFEKRGIRKRNSVSLSMILRANCAALVKAITIGQGSCAAPGSLSLTPQGRCDILVNLGSTPRGKYFILVSLSTIQRVSYENLKDLWSS